MSFAEELVHDLLEKSQNPALQFKLKVNEKTLLLDKVATDFKARKETRRIIKQEKRKKKQLSSKERKRLGLDAIPKLLEWNQMLPLHQLWVDYTEMVFAENSAIGTFTRLDYHGALLTIIESKTPSHVGMMGICVKESEQMFYLVGKNNQVRSIPKAGHVFTFCVKDHLYTLYGNHFCHRPGDRTTKKFKPKVTIAL